jgi:putative RNA 2'-phosphotransferase
MTPKETTRASKFLSLVLRHKPETIELTLDEAGWVRVEELLRALNAHRFPLNLNQLQHIVANCEKKRFAFSEDGSSIRASQGHSIEVDLQYPTQIPPNSSITVQPPVFSTTSASWGF